MEEVIFNRSDIPATYDGLHYKNGKILMKLKNITKFVMLYDLGKKENRPKNVGVKQGRTVSLLIGVEHPLDLYAVQCFTPQN